MHILMLAAENGAVPGGKVGGMGDVIRDIPRALASLGHRVTVLTPGYDSFSRLPGSVPCAVVETRFRGAATQLKLFRLAPDDARPGVEQFVLEHALFATGGAGRIYCDDPPDRPFATDASKFALFCAAAGSALIGRQLEMPDVVHLHDWHSAMLAVLIRCDPAYAALAPVPLVYTIHNLALQGIRPFDGDDSSLCQWFPGLAIARSCLRDPRYPDCFNPMRAAINLCSKVHAVSPTYAHEICDAHGESGAGLQADLRQARDEGRLEGILNGCEYPATAAPPMQFNALLGVARDAVLRWVGADSQVVSADLIALRRLDDWIEEGRARPGLLLTSVGRLTEQKVGLLMARESDGRASLEHMLDCLQGDELLIVLGSGDPLIELFFSDVAARYSRLLFLRGFSDVLAEQLYAGGDLFLMPSSFEPCGISQMLAMRAGQPCLVNAVGGLSDTVDDARNGFVFQPGPGSDIGTAMLQRYARALALLRDDPAATQTLRQAAAAARFHWSTAAEAYISRLYVVTAKARSRPRPNSSTPEVSSGAQPPPD